MKDSESEPVLPLIAYTSTTDIQTMKKFIMDKMGHHPLGDGEHHLRLKSEVMEDYDAAMQRILDSNPPLPQTPPHEPYTNFTLPKIETIEPDSAVVKAEPERPGESGAPTSNDKEETEVCRDYLRQNCKRLVCTFRHEYDGSKARNLYNFCRDFQNKGCTYPVCKYAHATVFEQEYYYKTGYLPPSALSHQKPENNKDRGNIRVKPMIGGVPTSWRRTPPLPPPQVNGNNDINPTNVNPATRADRITPVSPTQNGSRETSLTNGEQLKRSWTDTTEINVPLRGQDVKRTQLKCESCMLLENRVHQFNLKLERMYSAKEEYTRKTQILIEHEQKMLEFVLKYLLHLSSEKMVVTNAEAQWQVNTTKP